MGFSYNSYNQLIPTIMFKLSSDGASGCLQTQVYASYNKLVEMFGEPNSDGDGYKVSTEWVVEDENGCVCTIYDYKETDLYDRDNPSVEAFRDLPEYEWHIGGNDFKTAKKLVSYIQSKVVI